MTYSWETFTFVSSIWLRRRALYHWTMRIYVLYLLFFFWQYFLYITKLFSTPFFSTADWAFVQQWRKDDERLLGKRVVFHTPRNIGGALLVFSHPLSKMFLFLLFQWIKKETAWTTNGKKLLVKEERTSDGGRLESLLNRRRPRHIFYSRIRSSNSNSLW